MAYYHEHKKKEKYAKVLLGLLNFKQTKILVYGTPALSAVLLRLQQRF